ncbi:MAG TPA: hypothetical protein VI911_08610 [Patescibacteria group bacterium]|nr:MAG: hypothetical protein UR43_C0005G0111 [candidate division TM6 bacterium GW2011_GWF2_33_332]HLD91057.1 hypothetical protein [Patescibacteria group bacterium]
MSSGLSWAYEQIKEEERSNKLTEKQRQKEADEEKKKWLRTQEVFDLQNEHKNSDEYRESLKLIEEKNLILTILQEDYNLKVKEINNKYWKNIENLQNIAKNKNKEEYERKLELINKKYK